MCVGVSIMSHQMVGNGLQDGPLTLFWGDRLGWTRSKSSWLWSRTVGAKLGRVQRWLLCAGSLGWLRSGTGGEGPESGIRAQAQGPPVGC